MRETVARSLIPLAIDKMLILSNSFWLTLVPASALCSARESLPTLLQSTEL